MSPCVQFHHRDPGIIGLMTRYLNDHEEKDRDPGIIRPTTRYSNNREEKDKKTIFYSLITDTHHTSPYAVRLAYRANKKGNSSIHDAVTIMHYILRHHNSIR